jgi:N6-L-threonylcarbamoyladenine synthase
LIVLGIETSCDETAAAVVRDGLTVLSSAVATQIQLHQPYQGVVPELASRAHVETVNAVIDKALTDAKISADLKNIDAIGVTVGPGLAGALLVGRMTADVMGWVHSKPVIGVNHIEGHLLSPLLEDPSVKPPFLGLVVSGGHTELIHSKKWGHYELIGRTRDDAAGEAFDKVAKMMGLSYPGGPVIDRLAAQGTASRQPFPRAWLPGSWDFSFSGLKTAMLYRLKEKKTWSLAAKRDLCAGFQDSVIDVLVRKTFAAAAALKLRTVVVGGGVAANRLLRRRLEQTARAQKIRLLVANPALCTDNAVMIGAAAYFKTTYARASRKDPLRIEPQLHIPLAARFPKAPGNFATFPLPY